LKHAQVNRNAEVAVLHERQKNQSKSVHTFIEQLDKIVTDWRAHPIPEQSIQQLKRIEEEYKREGSHIRDAVQQLGTVLHGLQVEKSQTIKEQERCAKRIKENHEREAIVIQIKDLAAFKQEKKEQLQLCMKEQDENKKLVDLLHAQLRDLEDAQRLIQTHVESSFTQAAINTALIQEIRANPNIVANRWMQKKTKRTHS
jgi:hypothetical protein